MVTLLAATLLWGCGAVQTPTEPPNFEELVAFNSYENILKEHSNFYVKNTCTATNAEESYIEDAVFFHGDGKVDYHMRHTNAASGAIVEDLSRVGSQWYYYDARDASYAALELGELYTLDYTIPEIFDCQPTGEAYIDGDYIVHDASVIYEGEEATDTRRREFTFYFDKETKLLSRQTATLYNNEQEVLATYVIDYSYDVKVADVFDITMIEKVNNSEKRIDLEIMIGYNTAEQEAHSLVTTTDAILYALVNGEPYLLYTDTEFENAVTTLDAYEGAKAMTLYAKILEFDE